MPYDNSKGGKIRNKLFRFHAGAPKPKETSYKVLAEVEETPILFVPKDLCADFAVGLLNSCVIFNICFDIWNFLYEFQRCVR